MDGTITIGAKIETKQFDRQIDHLEKEIATMEKAYSTGLQVFRPEDADDMEKLARDIEKAKNQLAGLYQQKAKVDGGGGFKNLNKSLQDSMKSVSRLIVGIFGIRTAYMAVRRASSALAAYDQQYATNLEYIRWVLTQMIAPVMRWIVGLAQTLLGYIYAILNAWFGIGKRVDASAEAFAKMKGGAGGVAKAAKEIRKQLAGFDEMNVLSDNVGASGGGGGGGAVMPDFDVSKMQGPPPAWLQFIMDNKDLIIAAIMGIAAAIWAIHAGATALQALGIGLLVGGIVDAILGVIEYIQDPSWENFGQIIQGIGIAVTGLGMVIGALPVAIAGAIALIVGLVVSNWEAIKATLENGLNWLKEKTDWVAENFGMVGKFIYETFTDLLEALLRIFDSLFTGIKGIFDGIITFFKGVFTGNWKQAWEGLKQITGNIMNIIGDTFGTIIDTMGKIGQNFWNLLANGARLAWEGIKIVFSAVVSFFRSTFETAWTAVKNVFSTGGRIFDGIKEGIVSAFKTIVNAIITGINKVVSIPFNGINNVLNKIRNIDILGNKPFTWIGTISVPQIPLLKTGGIVSMPNKGTPVGGALAGEAGREGVIPLTDSQAMEELGRAIGRYINLNATIPVYVGNRQIAREIKRIDAEDNFAFNA